MALELNGTTGVSLVQDGVVTADDLSSTLDLSGKTVTLPSGVGGKVLQVVETIKTDVFSTTSGTFTDITGLSASITPSSSSSKILVLTYAGAGSSNNGYSAAFRLLRDSTPIAIPDAAGSRLQAIFKIHCQSSDHTYFSSANFLDSPATTSSVTYKIQMARQNGTTTLYINRSGVDSDSSDAYHARSISGITLMEIAG